MTDECIGVRIAPLTASIYASWSAEMEALVRAKGLWKCTQVLAQDFMTTLETVRREKTRSRPSSTKDFAQGSLLPKMCGRNSRVIWKGKNLTPRFIY